jgi:hypothetical protein
VILEVAEGSPEERTDCDLASTGIAAKAVVTNSRSVARCIIVPAHLLPDWPPRLAVGPSGLANKKCDSEIHLDDRIVSPLICIANLRHGIRRQRTVVMPSYTYKDVFRMESFKDGHICTQSPIVCFCNDRVGQSKRKLPH